MIFGIGSDLVRISRIAQARAKQPQRFAQRLLSTKELAQWERLATMRRDNFLAKRWAAKEALGKALGTGIVAPVLLPAITVTHTALGRPCFELAAPLHAFIENELMAQQTMRLHLSLSDDADLLQAFVIAEMLPR